MTNSSKTAEIKERLKAYTRLLREIENTEERLELMELETPGGRLTETKRARLKDELAAQLIEEERQHNELENYLQKIEDPDERAVIRLRYFDRRDWDCIVDAIYGTNAGLCDNPEKFKRRAQKLHGQALLDLAAVIDAESKKKN